MKGILKPSPESIRRLALLEASTSGAKRLSPICKGPLVAFMLVVIVGLIGFISGLVVACGRLLTPSAFRRSNG